MPILPSHLHLRPMQLSDIPFAMKLKTMGNWNQVESDWEFLLSTNAEGCFVALYNEKEVGTVTTLTYPHAFSWIGMVLVDPAYRGLGIGTALLQRAIHYARSKGTIRLDATPQGEKLYCTLGFEVERHLLRLERKQTAFLPELTSKCPAIDRDIIEQILKIDLAVFGANRARVLQYLLNIAPQYACYTERNGRITGYCFGRPGSNFEHIGPIVAENYTDARHLLLTAMSSNPAKPFIVDVPAQAHQWLDELKTAGFTTQRPFIRMHLGTLKNAGNPGMSYAIAGPELG
ncbi:GNAT family N-acetyltransferase [Rhodocytophaga aerolata]|uniref:GNAT family N-acetyltransferase n=1 Tax=Rhodocytophaga aerolata TaxID=455078 RepID=A0ABT8RD24_9BACT|nr:GNAT family N-acetyltransferase [Rhodocytophaga aerolata]MDO1449990.1 GNAT family N-acetyltransferase [Rhodocytophaga aerolata]